jgi:CRP-like cAMP-binding protein
MTEDWSLDRVVAVLGETTLFGKLDQASLQAVAQSCVVRHNRRDQFLWFKGDVGDYLIAIASGRVKVVVTSKEGDELVLVTLGPTETLGELSVIDAGARSASVVTLEDTTILRVTRNALYQIARANPAVMDALMRSVGRLVRRLTEQASDLVFLDLTGRVAKLLVQLSQDEGSQHQPTRRIDLGLTQTDLANMVGASRPALNRILQGLVARGWITIEGRAILVLDDRGLRRRAGMGG